eukprot:NODE_9717_length_1403_cov_6.709248.p1 GENE.NODE_9717_length_1403_cov_6.709248~~NODE_9717_length_1403_cov_6.709248.p1  ORF type:complete len:249 (+),score=66.82 NODE_9717_length_1403_cov_6.709248:40-786(+)
MCIRGRVSTQSTWELRLRVPVKPLVSIRAPLSGRLSELRRIGACFCDLELIAGGERFPVHRVVLAAQSSRLRDLMLELKPERKPKQQPENEPEEQPEEQPEPRPEEQPEVQPEEQLREQGKHAELDLGNVSPEAAALLVRWIYEELDVATYHPSSPRINEELMRLSSTFDLPVLSEMCVARLAANITVETAVENMSLCQELGLIELRAAILLAIIKDKAMLRAVSSDVGTLQHPALMRELLVAIAHGS